MTIDEFTIYEKSDVNTLVNRIINLENKVNLLLEERKKIQLKKKQKEEYDNLINSIILENIFYHYY
ncbi:MAG: hypothetical protein CMF96_10565 [Candidatus Marinimicrobia bacterium]|nr:hypothetical protein [Candidatus Neomarinimicrobiota bacterium]